MRFRECLLCVLFLVFWENSRAGCFFISPLNTSGPREQDGATTNPSMVPTSPLKPVVGSASAEASVMLGENTGSRFEASASSKASVSMNGENQSQQIGSRIVRLLNGQIVNIVNDGVTPRSTNMEGFTLPDILPVTRVPVPGGEPPQNLPDFGLGTTPATGLGPRVDLPGGVAPDLLPPNPPASGVPFDPLDGTITTPATGLGPRIDLPGGVAPGLLPPNPPASGVPFDPLDGAITTPATGVVPRVDLPGGVAPGLLPPDTIPGVDGNPPGVNIAPGGPSSRPSPGGNPIAPPTNGAPFVPSGLPGIDTPIVPPVNPNDLPRSGAGVVPEGVLPTQLPRPVGSITASGVPAGTNNAPVAPFVISRAGSVVGAN